MFLSRSTEYALRAVAYLAVHSSPDRRFGVRKISKDLHFPESFLAKILQELSRKRIVHSIKGPSGGFYMDQDLEQISLLQLIEAMEGLNFFKTCGLGLDECSHENPCPIHEDYSAYRDGLYKVLERKTIRDLKADIENGNTFIERIAPGQDLEQTGV
jgi:Rrf2 family iron-sulfur cluster assembly transcriptional regulator